MPTHPDAWKEVIDSVFEFLLPDLGLPATVEWHVRWRTPDGSETKYFHSEPSLREFTDDLRLTFDVRDIRVYTRRVTRWKKEEA